MVMSQDPERVRERERDRERSAQPSFYEHDLDD